ncbi:PREDICTED: RNA-binding protein 7 [Dufourea novaeangliae]|uniref:Putative RNA-binding protein 11 n=1 Tax=Dufourea novaeangliae TaxID=178035 RepID=A0A154PH47_DUFNO|nr:PREDICTED: RNA-binding protein 7 [Dufourea novaeangliae]KZC10500.1 Putative RNA-binding protein 11 [Dufourea novaeangliae]
MDEEIRTLWCGNLSEKVTEEILYELFLQGGPVQRVSIPRDRDGKQRTYGFVIYKHIDSVSYALKLFDGTMLFNRSICISTRNNTDLPQKTNSQDQIYDVNHLLQLGQQMKVDIFGTSMLPSSSGLHCKQLDVHSYNDDRRSRRAHPYQREQNKNNHHKDQRSRNTRDGHRLSAYSRRDYKNNRRNYY